jgi:hypothetical protein
MDNHYSEGINELPEGSEGFTTTGVLYTPFRPAVAKQLVDHLNALLCEERHSEIDDLLEALHVVHWHLENSRVIFDP